MRILLALTAWMAFQSAPAFADKDEAHVWSVDPGHASIIFKINHLGFSDVYGMFSGLEGDIKLNDAKPEKSSFELKLPADKLNTGSQKRDDHVRGPDFFNTKQFSTITLKSKTVKKTGENKYDISADLTLHGKTNPVNFTFHRNKTGKDPWGGTRTGGQASFKIKRGEYGVNFMNKPGEIGDEVELIVSLEAVQK